MLESSKVDAFSGEVCLDPGISIEPAPGHTLGHSLLRVARGGKTALLIGDVMHALLQRDYPFLNSATEADPEQAARTRVRVLEEASAAGALILPAHLPAPYGFSYSP